MSDKEMRAEYDAQHNEWPGLDWFTWQLAWHAARPSAAPAIPEGFALVPIRPNQDMCYAGQIKAREWPKFPLRIAPIYQAMLAAAPKAGE
ncbi:hypothetical protein AWB77_06722 [Caballeronia fortuita]|uniref:Uncharacterized protein n=1 Tax=Caballeronia fortuita TaxID=1777138 RepID=A0A158E8P0_9BURK|nr:hypothetical protein [Caballeronia fortuita]SAL03154.1 hypothetical protein AWB77_06722 [Caballeronia fortuita]